MATELWVVYVLESCWHRVGIKGVVRTAVTFLLTVRDIAENQPCFTALEGLLCSRKISGAEGVCHDFK